MREEEIPLVYVKNKNYKIICMKGTRSAFRMRQRDSTKKGFNFISFKEMKSKHKNNIAMGCFEYSHRPKL